MSGDHGTWAGANVMSGMASSTADESPGIERYDSTRNSNRPSEDPMAESGNVTVMPSAATERGAVLD